MAIGVVRILFLLFGRRNSLPHAAWAPDSDGEWRDILGDNGTGSDGGALSDPDSGENDDIAADPAIILDEDRMSEFNKLPPRQNAGIVTCSKDAHAGAHLDPIANHHQARV